MNPSFCLQVHRARRVGISGLSGVLLVFTLMACTQTTTLPGDSETGSPVSIEITGAVTAQAGSSVSLNAVLKDSAGNALSSLIAWSSSDSAVIPVGPDGTVYARRIGTVTITAAWGSLRDSIVFTSSLAPYTFIFADTVSPSDRRIILDGVLNAHRFQVDHLGRAITDSTVITGSFSASGCASGGSAAFAGAGAITFCLNNQGWKVHGPVIKQKIVQHELFHVWQFESGWISNPATAGAMWIIEGSAELMGFRGIAEKTLLPFSTALGCQVKEAADFAVRQPPGLPSLQSVEGRQAFQTTPGPLYTHSMLAAYFLTWQSSAAAKPGIKAESPNWYGLHKLRDYGDSVMAAGTANGWQTAFQSAFGISPATFYSEFPTDLAGLAVPTNYLCGL